MAFFVFFEVGGVRGKSAKAGFWVMLENFEIKKAFTVVICFFII